MPAYNVGKYLRVAAESVMAQTYRACELIIVDDGSTDETSVVAAQLQQRWADRIRVISQHNKGLSEARNTALGAARGEYLALLDSDDLWQPGFLAAQVEVLESRPEIDIVTGNAWYLGGPRHREPLRPVVDTRPEPTLRTILTDDEAVFIMSVFRRKVYETIGGFSVTLRTNEDFDYWLRAAHAGFRFARTATPLGWYRVRPDSLSADEVRMLRGAVRVLREFEPRLAPASPEAEALKWQLHRFEARLPAAAARLGWREPITLSQREFFRAVHSLGGPKRALSASLGRYAPSAFHRLDTFRHRLRQRRRRRSAAPPTPRSRQGSFLHNVAWGWFGVGVNIIVSLVMAPLLIRRLGVDQYGLWVLLFSTIEYLRMLDFGFRAAAVNACARFRARQDWEGVNRTIATSALYFLVISVVCCAGAIALRDELIIALNVPAAHYDKARTLVPLIALAVAVRLMLLPLSAALEAFQRYDLVNQAYISALVFRSVGSIALLLLGYGLIEIATVILVAQVGENIWNAVSVKRAVPGFRVAASLVRLEVLTQLFQYGRHSAVWVIALVMSLQVPNTLIGYLLGPVAVGFFALPLRLLLYITEALTKVSDVTSSVTAELDETRSTEKLRRLAILTNRHSLALFTPAAIFLGVYGTPLLAVWVSPEVAANSAPLIPVMLINFLLAVAGQHNAGAVLLGQGKHAKYANAIAIEVVLSTIGLLLVIPRFGILGAAWVLTIASLLTRGVYLAVLTCRLNGFRLGEYVSAIYAGPLLTGVPVLLLAVALRYSLWPGSSWVELIAAAVVIASAYFATAFFSVLEYEHREKLRTWLVSGARA